MVITERFCHYFEKETTFADRILPLYYFIFLKISNTREYLVFEILKKKKKKKKMLATFKRKSLLAQGASSYF